MKKIFIWLLATICIISIGFMGAGCKISEAAEEAVEEVAEEIAEEVEEAVEEVEEAVEEVTIDEPVTIEIYMQELMPDTQAGIELNIAKMEEMYPNVTVNVTYEPYTVYMDNMKLRSAANDLPDLTWGLGKGDGDLHGEAGSIQDWWPIVEANPDLKELIHPIQFTASAGDYVQMPMCTLPGNFAGLGFFVNLNVMNDLGLEPVDTWDGLLAQIPVIKDAGYEVFAHGAKDVWSTWGFNQFLRRFMAGDNQNDDIFMILNQEAKFSDFPKWVEGLNLLKDLADAGAFPEDTATMEFGRAIAMFNENKAAYWCVGTFMSPSATEALGDNYAWWSMPPLPGAIDTRPSFELATGGGWMLSSNVEEGPKLDAIIELMKLYGDKEWGQMYLETTSEIPASNHEWDYSNANAGLRTMGDSWAQGNIIPGQMEVYWPTAFGLAIYNEGVTNVLAGLGTPEETIAMWDDWLEQHFME